MLDTASAAVNATNRPHALAVNHLLTRFAAGNSDRECALAP